MEGKKESSFSSHVTIQSNKNLINKTFKEFNLKNFQLKGLSPLLEDASIKLIKFISNLIEKDENHAFDAKLVSILFTLSTLSC